ncbi:sugar transferase [Demequina litorisediminis]|uniref:sugar transferase n=1 Tax=Demequina litorisediminis TaxID=1849022 RepID=UPI0032AF1891
MWGRVHRCPEKSRRGKRPRGWRAARLVKPGITGLWQVSGRSDLSWEDSVRLDLHYTQNWTMSLDAVIVLRTVWAVLTGRGAY